MKNIIIALLLAIFAIPSFGQSISIFDIDTTNFPTMKAKFYAFDENGKPYTPNISDMKLSENGIQKKITNISCPPVKLNSISVGIMVDTYNYIGLAKAGTKKLIDFLQMPNDELGITYMAHGVYIYQDFTKSKTKALDKASTIPSAPGVDINSMFNSPITGGMPLIKDRKNDKKVLILISDLHCPNLTIDEAKLINEAKTKGISIYSVLLGTNDYSGLFTRIANGTGGKVFERVNSETQITNIFNEIEKEEHYEPCVIEWEGGYSCGEFLLNVNYKNILWEGYFVNSYKSKSYLNINPKSLSFGRVQPNTINDTIIKITAVNSDIEISSIEIFKSDKSIEILNVIYPFTVKKDSSINLTLRYSPSDSIFKVNSLIFHNNRCDNNLSFNAGFIEKKDNSFNLTLTKPNGGEKYFVGSDSIITWKGISPNEEVIISYSINKGITWNVLTKEAKNLKYIWKNIPLPSSNNCLVKVQLAKKLNNDTLPKIEFQRTYGGSSMDHVRSIIPAMEGGYIVLGHSESSDGDKNSKSGLDFDIWIIKIDELGEISWQKTLSGGIDDYATKVINSHDGGYLITGSSLSKYFVFDKDTNLMQSNHLKNNIIVLKIDKFGNFVWFKEYGGSLNEEAKDIRQTFDGGYIIAGTTQSNDGDITTNYGNLDAWIIKIDSLGNLVWEKSYGGNQDDGANNIIQTSDNGYIFVGYSNSNNFILNKGLADCWVQKIDSNGNLLWNKTYGGDGNDIAMSIIETSDFGYLVAATSNSDKGDKIVKKGNNDSWYYKLDNLGKLEWEKTIGGEFADESVKIISTYDDGYLLALYSASLKGDFNTKVEWNASWCIKLSKTGEILWKKKLDGGQNDFVFDLIETLDGGYAVALSTNSKNLDVTINKGEYDYWVVKLSPLMNIVQTDNSDSLFSIIAPEPRFNNLNIDMGQVVVGDTKDTMVTAVLCNYGEAPLHILGVDVTNGDKDDFMVPRGAGEFYLAPNECRDFMFSFMPMKLGPLAAKITVKSTVGDFVDTISIIGVGIAPQLEVVNKLIDFGNVDLGTYKDTIQAVTIRNSGTTPINITNVKLDILNDIDFAKLNKFIPFTLNAGDTVKMDLRFTPRFIGRTSGILLFEFNGTGSPAKVELMGNGLGGNVLLKVGRAEEYAGKRIDIPITLIGNNKFFASGIKYINLELQFNKTILYPTQQNKITVKNGLKYIKLDSVPIVNGEFNQIIAKLNFNTALGSADETPINVTDYELIGGDADLVVEHGNFKLLGICYEGGERLLVGNKSKTMLLSIAPNPAAESIEIEYSNADEGIAEIIISNLLGQTILTQKLEKTQTGFTKMDLSQLPTGQYSILFKTETIQENKKLIIIK